MSLQPWLILSLSGNALLAMAFAAQAPGTDRPRKAASPAATATDEKPRASPLWEAPRSTLGGTPPGQPVGNWPAGQEVPPGYALLPVKEIADSQVSGMDLHLSDYFLTELGLDAAQMKTVRQATDLLLEGIAKAEAAVMRTGAEAVPKEMLDADPSLRQQITEAKSVHYVPPLVEPMKEVQREFKRMLEDSLDETQASIVARLYDESGMVHLHVGDKGGYVFTTRPGLHGEVHALIKSSSWTLSLVRGPYSDTSALQRRFGHLLPASPLP